MYSVLTENLNSVTFLRRISKLVVHLNLLKLVLLLSHYLISNKCEAADEIMAKVHHLFLEVKMDFNSRNLLKKRLHRNLLIPALVLVLVMSCPSLPDVGLVVAQGSLDPFHVGLRWPQ